MFRFRHHGKQFAKSDIVDIAKAIGLKASDSMSVGVLRALVTIHFNTGSAGDAAFDAQVAEINNDPDADTTCPDCGRFQPPRCPCGV